MHILGSGFAAAVNESDVVVGRFGPTTAHAFTWRAGRLTMLPTIDGAASDALAVNDAGLVGGEIGFRAVIWRNGTIVAIRCRPAPP